MAFKPSPNVKSSLFVAALFLAGLPLKANPLPIFPFQSPSAIAVSDYDVQGLMYSRPTSSFADTCRSISSTPPAQTDCTVSAFIFDEQIIGGNLLVDTSASSAPGILKAEVIAKAEMGQPGFINFRAFSGSGFTDYLIFTGPPNTFAELSASIIVEATGLRVSNVGGGGADVRQFFTTSFNSDFGISSVSTAGAGGGVNSTSGPQGPFVTPLKSTLRFDNDGVARSTFIMGIDVTVSGRADPTNCTYSDPIAAYICTPAAEIFAEGIYGNSVYWGGIEGITADSIPVEYQVFSASGLDYRNSTRPSAPNVETAPGPLPVLGAAAAFGYSRKIRKRIKATRTTVPTRPAG